MTSGQKVIKYLGIAFAIFLIVNIISGILYGITTLVQTIDFFNNSNDSVLEVNKELEIENTIEKIDINLSATKLIIKTGEKLKAETNNDFIKIRQKNNQYFIEEKKQGLFRKYDNLELILYLPSDFYFDTVKIEAGAGSIKIDSLKTKHLKFDLGAGVTEIRNLEVLDKTSIESGAGEMKILNGNLHNLDLDMGVGKLSLTSNLTGKTTIEAGVGELNLNILNKKEEYSIQVDKGIGSILIDSSKVSDGDVIGNGENVLKIDGGIGKITVDFKEESDKEDIKDKIDYRATIEVLDYFKNKNEEYVVLGKILNGNFKDMDTVDLLEEETVIKTTTILSENDISLEEAKPFDKVLFTLKDVTLDEIKRVDKVVIK